MRFLKSPDAGSVISCEDLKDQDPINIDSAFVLGLSSAILLIGSTLWGSALHGKQRIRTKTSEKKQGEFKEALLKQGGNMMGVSDHTFFCVAF